MSSCDIDYLDLNLPRQPEVGLFAAVVLQALADIEDGIRASNAIAQGKKYGARLAALRFRVGIAHEAARWIFDDTYSSRLNSFSTICELLNLCPVRVRNSIKAKFPAVSE